MPTNRLIPFALLLGVACSGGGSQFGGGAGSKSDDKDKETKVVDHSGSSGTASAEEEASVPLIVSGAYLICGDIEMPEGETADLAVGCDLSSKDTGKPVALKTIAKNDWTWKATPPDGKDVTVAVKESKDPKDGEHQALYLFSGGDADSRRATADETGVRLDLALTEPVDDVEFFAAKIKDAKAGAANKTKTKEEEDVGSITTDNPSLDPTGDQDKDLVLNGEDKCDASPAGAAVWTKAKANGDPALDKWIGCSGGEYGDTDDADHDKIADLFDKCKTTPVGETVVATEDDPRRGCAKDETPQ